MGKRNFKLPLFLERFGEKRCSDLFLDPNSKKVIDRISKSKKKITSGVESSFSLFEHSLDYGTTTCLGIF